MAEKVIKPLFDANEVALPRGTNAFDILDQLVPANDNIPLLTQLYWDLTQHGVDSGMYPILVQLANASWGGLIKAFL
jgi:hypothetical protein